MRYTTLYKIFAAYLVIVLLICVTGFTLLQRINKVYRTEVYNNLASDLNFFQKNMDQNLETLQNVATQLSLTIGSKSYDFEENVLSANEIKETLGIYYNNNLFFDNIVLYLKNSPELLVSPSSTYTMSFFEDRVLLSENSTTDWDKLLNGVQHSTILSDINAHSLFMNGKGIVLLYPVFASDLEVSGVLMVFVSNSQIERMMPPQLSEYNAYFEVCDASEKIIYNTRSDIEGSAQKFFECNSVSAYNGWKYTAFFPQRDALLERMNSLVGIQFVNILVVVLSLAALLMFVIRSLYLPLKKLQKKAGSTLPQKIAKDEFSAIENAISSLTTENSSLSEQLKAALMSETNNTLRKLLHGEYDSEEEILKKCTDTDIVFSHDSFFVIYASFRNNVPNSRTLKVFFRQFGDLTVDFYPVFTAEKGSFYVLGCCGCVAEKRILSKCEVLRASLQADLNTSVTFGVGKRCESVENIPRSFAQAKMAFGYHFVRGNNTTIGFSEILISHSAPLYPQEKFSKLANALRSRDQDSVQKQVQSISEYIRDNCLPLFSAKGICFEMLSQLIENAPSSALQQQTQRDLLLLSDLDTVQDVLYIIEELYKELYSKATTTPEDSSVKLELKAVYHYLSEHALECDFSVQKVAEHFGVWAPNLSQFFKEQSNEGILEYVTELRMKEAKHLLVETDFPLNIVAEKVGYYNVSSFIRRFKQTQGITPGTYRSSIISKAKDSR